MKNRNCLGSAAAIIIVMVSLIMAGCSLKKEEAPPPAPVYGVADLETLVKAHPKYSEYFKLETEYNHLLDQYQNERKRLIAIPRPRIIFPINITTTYFQFIFLIHSLISFPP